MGKSILVVPFGEIIWITEVLQSGLRNIFNRDIIVAAPAAEPQYTPSTAKENSIPPKSCC
ncbi:MAG: hypothetical protein ACLPN1_15055 [Dissulfurispiraceae bacterium]|jgi:hypothetical protein